MRSRCFSRKGKGWGSSIAWAWSSSCAVVMVRHVLPPGDTTGELLLYSTVRTISVRAKKVAMEVHRHPMNRFYCTVYTTGMIRFARMTKEFGGASRHHMTEYHRHRSLSFRLRSYSTGKHCLKTTTSSTPGTKQKRGARRGRRLHRGRRTILTSTPWGWRYFAARTRAMAIPSRLGRAMGS